ncbi:MAG: hypothetical protein M3R47_06770 [Chloroflexota bacterium]|nr:hypothetical protein [Chloroflexota bacterium]
MNKKTGNEKITTNQELSAQVKKWAEEQGYSLEMRVAKKFQESGFAVSQFEHFVDQESHDVRPVDVVATLSQDFGNCRIAIRLFAECKYSAKDKPWVIVVTSDKFDKYSFFSRMLKGVHPSNWATVNSLQGRMTARLIQSIERNFGLDAFSIKNPGYAVAEAFKTQGDHAYEAIAQIGKCVEAHDNEAEDIYRTMLQSWEQIDFQISPSQLGFFFSITFSMVVINGQLFESYLTENNVVEVSEIEYGTVFVPDRRRETIPNSEITLSPVTIVTEKYLDNYVTSMKVAMESILSQTEAIQEVISYEQEQIINPHREDDF